MPIFSSKSGHKKKLYEQKSAFAEDAEQLVALTFFEKSL